jgi:hypothetical protein
MATLLFSPPPAGPILTAIRANNIIKDDDGSKSSDFLSLFPECKTNPLRALCFKYRRIKKMAAKFKAAPFRSVQFHAHNPRRGAWQFYAIFCPHQEICEPKYTS